MNKYEKEIKELKEIIKKQEKKIEDLECVILLEDNRVNLNKFLRNNYSFLRKNGIFLYIKAFFKGIGTIIKKIFKLIFRKVEYLMPIFTFKRIIRQNKGKKIIVFYPGYGGL